MKVNSVIASGKNVLPVFQSIVSLIIPLTKSKIHSMTFCAPVGFICNFLAPKTDRIKTIADVTIIINTFDKFTDSQGIPNTFSMIGAPCSIVSPLFQRLFPIEPYKIYHHDWISCHQSNNKTNYAQIVTDCYKYTQCCCSKS